MNSPTLLSRYREAFLRLLYPSACALCGEMLRLEEKGTCSGCLEKLSKQKFSPADERVRIKLKYADEAWALFHYEAETREVLQKIKFERRRDLLQLFRPFLNEFFERRPELTFYETLVPIPLDPKRRWEREFNQSGLLAESVRQAARPKDAGRLRLRRRALLKKRSTLPQSRLGREARQQNLQETFRLSRFPRLRSSSVLLIDDIFTTGATFEEAAKVLKASGVSRVGYLALSRALLH